MAKSFKEIRLAAEAEADALAARVEATGRRVSRLVGKRWFTAHLEQVEAALGLAPGWLPAGAWDHPEATVAVEWDGYEWTLRAMDRGSFMHRHLVAEDVPTAQVAAIVAEIEARAAA